jgi:hypothetical protein
VGAGAAGVAGRAAADRGGAAGAGRVSTAGRTVGVANRSRCDRRGCGRRPRGYSDLRFHRAPARQAATLRLAGAFVVHGGLQLHPPVRAASPPGVAIWATTAVVALFLRPRGDLRGQSCVRQPNPTEEHRGDHRCG